MFNGIRARLLLSYLVVVLLTVVVSTGAMLLILSARPAPPDQTYRDLLNYLSGVDFAALRPTRPLRDAQTWIDNIMAQASERDVRVLVVSQAMQTVQQDSAGVLAAGDTLPVREGSVSRQRIERSARLPIQVAYVTGEFTDDAGQAWLFIGVGGDIAPAPPDPASPRTGPLGGRRLSPEAQGLFGDQMLLFALPRESISLIQAIDQFGADLGLVLVQAALIGLVVAGLAGVAVSRTIARPLQRLSVAAHAVAGGDYTHRVAEQGATEFKQVAGAFNHMSEQVQLTNQAQRDLLANVSHDLKTPLTSIQGFSQAIMDGTAPDPAKAAAIINEEAGRLGRLVTLLTELARIRAGRLTMRQDALDLKAMVTAMAEKIDVVAQKKDITLTVDAAPVPVVRGDGDRLAQVVNNLLSNAVKYTPSGGRVLVRVAPARGGVVVAVRDTGVGIPAADLSRVFERFYQVDKARGPARGHGLGLAITHEIVTAHGGEITVDSAGRDQGSTFTVWLPVADAGA